MRLFRNLYDQEPLQNILPLAGILPCIDEELAANLEVLLTLEEVKAAVCNCDPSQSTGHDGFNIKFIKNF